MATTVEQLGQIHTNYNDFPKDTINGANVDKSNFHDFVLSMLKAYENAALSIGSVDESSIHNGGPNPTIGYGFDLAKWGTWANTKALLIWGLGGAAGLSAQQLEGVQLIEDWRTAYNLNPDSQDTADKRKIV